MLEAIDGDGDVDFFGRGVARVGKRFVERADPHRIVALALEIETGVEVGDERQIGETRAPDSKLDHGAAARLERDSRQTRANRDLVGPGPGRVDDDRGDDVAGAGLGDPSLARALGREEGRAGPHLTPATTNRGEAGGVEARHLDVGAARLEPGAGPLLAKPRHQAVERFAV